MLSLVIDARDVVLYVAKQTLHQSGGSIVGFACETPVGEQREDRGPVRLRVARAKTGDPMERDAPDPAGRVRATCNEPSMSCERRGRGACKPHQHAISLLKVPTSQTHIHLSQDVSCQYVPWSNERWRVIRVGVGADSFLLELGLVRWRGRPSQSDVSKERRRISQSRGGTTGKGARLTASSSSLLQCQRGSAAPTYCRLGQSSAQSNLRRTLRPVTHVQLSCASFSTSANVVASGAGDSSMSGTASVASKVI